MIVIDTSALIAIAQDEPEAAALREAMFGASELFIGAPTHFETMMVASRRLNGPDDMLALLNGYGVETLPWSASMARQALFAFERFGKSRHRAALNFGDCMAYAVAKELDAPLLFKGDDFAQTDIRSALAA